MARTRKTPTPPSPEDAAAEPIDASPPPPAPEPATTAPAPAVEQSVQMRGPGGHTVIVRESAVPQRLNAGWHVLR